MTTPIPPRRTGLGRRVADIVGGSDPDAEGGYGSRLLPGPEVVPLEAVPLAMLVADGTGRVHAVNDRWLEVSGLTRESSLGSGWLGALPPSERASLLAAIDQVASGGPAGRLEYRWEGTGDPATWFITSVARAGETLVGITVDSHPPAASEAAARAVGSGLGVEDERLRWELVGLLRSVDALLATLDRVVDRFPVLDLDVVPA